jgi:microcystin-dependent protein
MGQYIGEIRMFSFDKIPDGWLSCDGQSLEILDYMPLFGQIGILFGGDGRVNFNLPDLRGRTVNGQSADCPRGLYWGKENVSLEVSSMPKHTHTLMGCDADDNHPLPENHYLGIAKDSQSELFMYGGDGAKIALIAESLAPSGRGLAHNNIQPCLAFNFCIAYKGAVPEMEPTDGEEGADDVDKQQ